MSLRCGGLIEIDDKAFNTALKVHPKLGPALKSFLLKDKKVRDLLNKQDFDTLFERLNESRTSANIRALQYFLVTMLIYEDIDFLSHLSYIPQELFYSIDYINKIVIPSNIKSIDAGAFAMYGGNNTIHVDIYFEDDAGSRINRTPFAIYEADNQHVTITVHAKEGSEIEKMVKDAQLDWDFTSDPEINADCPLTFAGDVK